MMPMNLAFRPPAVPLVTCDPYFSIWSMADRLTDEWPKHWTGTTNALASMIRVDGQTFRLMGPEPKSAEAMELIGLQVLPTRTIYEFECAGVHVRLTFMTPLLPEDMDLLARPVSYLTWQMSSVDGAEHAVQLYFDHTGELVVNTADQQIIWSRHRIEGLTVLRMGSQEQPILEKQGDNLRIDWGYLYLAAPTQDWRTDVIANELATRPTFAETGQLPDSDELRMPRATRDEWPVSAVVSDLGMVGAEPVSRHVMLAYDDLFSIEYFYRRLRPYWRRSGWEAADLLRAAASEYPELAARCEMFDAELMADLTAAGGSEYAQVAALAYRQCIAAQKLAVDMDGTPLSFPKENFSNGCMATVDVIYPESSLPLLLSPELLKAQLTPVLNYANTPMWPFSFAPHDLGRYPQANGQVYGGGSKTEHNQMPVEESGNMILLVAAIAHAEGSVEYAQKYWNTLKLWAEYLKDKGLDPEHQLCTDDFTGHLAHNTNLSLKAILALRAYAKLCEMAGIQDEAQVYRETAEQFAEQWQQMADDGDHYRLAFDRPGTWSQKYNLVWDRILDLDLFPPGLAQKEVAFYKTKQNPYGLPLDSRSEFTKLDWIFWTATLAESQEDFELFAVRVYAFAQDSPSRVPLTDWYWTTDAKQRGMQARPVVGGVFIKMLADPTLWQKWVARSGGR